MFTVNSAQIPMLEPSNQQEAYEMARYGFELSEKLGTPVLMRVTTRLAHSRAGVEITEATKENDLKLPEDKRQFVLLPAIARKRYRLLLDKQVQFEEEGETKGYNKFIEGKDKSLGIIACGIGYNYLMENYTEEECPYSIVKVSQYPLPRKMVNKLAEECDKILVLEEGYPVVEELLKGYLEKENVSGRLDGNSFKRW